MRLATVSIAILLAGGTPALAQEEPQVDCANAVVQMELTFCAQKEHQAADVELNAVYKQAMMKMKATDADLGTEQTGAVAALKKAQRAWIGYRDGQCELAGFPARGGTAEPMLIYGCLADLTTRRTKELQAVLEDFSN